MGSVCCVAAKDKSIQNEPNSEILHRNVRYSPLWSIQWENRGRVAEEEIPIRRYSDGVGRNNGLESKSETVEETTHASEVAMPPLLEGNGVVLRTTPDSDAATDSAISRNTSTEVKALTDFPTESNKYPVKLSPMMSSTSSLSTHDYLKKWSFDSDSLGFNRDNFSRISNSPYINVQRCGVCSKLLTEKSSFSSQRIVECSDLSVVAVLLCGHIYHAECLENMTPEISKYDPACPVCILGPEKILKEEMKARKRLRNCVVEGAFDSLDRRKCSGREVKGLKMGSSSSMKNSFGKPFLKQHFSFGSKSSKSYAEISTTRAKGLFWGKSSKASSPSRLLW